MRRIVSLLFASVLAVGAFAPAAGAGTVPPLVGTGPRVAVRTPDPGTMTAVRIGRHATYDRIVFDIAGALPGWDVRYVNRVLADGSGLPVPVAGSAALRVVLHGVNGHDDAGRVTVTGRSVRPLWPALRQVRPAGDFEAVMTFAVGVADRLDFRVFGLSNPTRVVVDVAHPTGRAFTTAATQVWAPPSGGGDMRVGAIRTGGHPGYDRMVIDLPGAVLHPNIGTAYAGGMDDLPATSVKTVLWTFSHANRNESAVITYTGPRRIWVGLPNLRSITVSWLNPSEIHVVANTRVKHGYRMFVVPGPGMYRVVVDVAR